MTIQFHRLFEKHYRRLSPAVQIKVDLAIQIFLKDPFTPSLRNHALSGSLKNQRSVSVTEDLRIIYETINGHTVVLILDVGTHGQVYR